MLISTPTSTRKPMFNKIPNHNPLHNEEQISQTVQAISDFIFS